MRKGSKHKKETIEKISKAKLENPTRYWLGKKRSKETIEKIIVTKKKGWKEGKYIHFLKGTHKCLNTGRTWFKKGHKNSEKQRRIASEGWKGDKNPRWSGGRWKDGHGYVIVMTERGYRKEHRVVAEKILGRDLKRSETIHHINEIKDDNRPINLYYFPNDNKHKRYHGLKNKPKLKSNLWKL